MVLLLENVVKEYFKKIRGIVEEIFKFIFLEVFDLNELFKVIYINLS